MSDNRDHADITHVRKQGEVYTVVGVSRGKQASFHVDAKTLESMGHKDATSFMRRTINNITKHEE